MKFLHFEHTPEFGHNVKASCFIVFLFVIVCRQCDEDEQKQEVKHLAHAAYHPSTRRTGQNQRTSPPGGTVWQHAFREFCKACHSSELLSSKVEFHYFLTTRK